MLPETIAIQDKYGDKVNYVALNVENNKWIPEMLEYNVDGIPHFEFLDAQVKEQAVAIGKLPQKVLEGMQFVFSFSSEGLQSYVLDAQKG